MRSKEIKILSRINGMNKSSALRKKMLDIQNMEDELDEKIKRIIQKYKNFSKEDLFLKVELMKAFSDSHNWSYPLAVSVIQNYLL